MPDIRELPAFLQGPVRVNVPVVTTRRAKSVVGRALLCATVSLSMVALPGPVMAASGVATAPAETSTVVLGLEGSDQIGEALSQALRDAFDARGMSGGEPMTLVEFRMTMGCDGNDPECLAEGGDAMGVEKMVYGSVRAAAGGGYSVGLTLLDVPSKKLVREITQEVGADQLGAGEMEETARLLTAKLLGEDVEVPATAQKDDAAPPPPKADKGPKDKIVFGPYKPVPTWKYALVGVSGALLVGSVVTAAVTTSMIGPNGSVRDDLIKAAEDSLTDSKPSNDVDPDMEGDLCEAGRAAPPGEPGTVTNADITKVCNRADGLSTVATATWITTGVFAATTVAAVVLLFAHKEKAGASAMRRRGLRLGAVPRRGGAFLSAGFRF